MFKSPRKLESLSESFQALCDAVMDLDPQPLVGKVPEDLLESAHLLVMADTAVIRECANAAKDLSKAAPHEIIGMVSAHHQKLSHYLFIRSMILDGDTTDNADDTDLKIF